MHIAFVASECVPFSKTGGLADVVGALPRALAAAGHQVSVFTPRYRLTRIPDERTVVKSITVPFDDRYRFCSIVEGTGYPGVRFFFVDYPPFFDRDGLYGTASGDFPIMRSGSRFSAGLCSRHQRFSASRTFFTATIGRRR